MSIKKEWSMSQRLSIWEDLLSSPVKRISLHEMKIALLSQKEIVLTESGDFLEDSKQNRIKYLPVVM